MQERGDEGAAVLEKLLGPEASADGRPEPSEQSARRRKALSVYLDPLEQAQRDGGDLLEALDGIELDFWELEQLGYGLAGCASWQTLVAEGVAFRNKLQTDLGWIPDDREMNAFDATDLRRLLVTDAALGIALMAETQLAVNELVLEGEVEDAKRLTAFRNKISQAVAGLKERVGREGFANAEANSEPMITPAERASWTHRKAKQTDGPPAGSHRRPAPRASKPTAGPVTFKETTTADEAERPANSHLKPMLMLLGLLLAFWGVFILPKMRTKPLPQLTLQDVSPRTEIRHVVARPPSLYVKLDTPGWRSLSAEQRLTLVDDVGRTAAAAGYNGALFTLEDGSAAAQWFRERGSVLID